jgi:hypothetical protein
MQTESSRTEAVEMRSAFSCIECRRGAVIWRQCTPLVVFKPDYPKAETSGRYKIGGRNGTRLNHIRSWEVRTNIQNHATRLADQKPLRMFLWTLRRWSLHKATASWLLCDVTTKATDSAFASQTSSRCVLPWCDGLSSTSKQNGKSTANSLKQNTFCEATVSKSGMR